MSMGPPESLPAIFCAHANEVPTGYCPCTLICYCRQLGNTCCQITLHLTSAYPPVTVKPVADTSKLKKFTAEIRKPLEDEDHYIQRYELDALDARAAAICARDRFEAEMPEMRDRAGSMYIVRVWQDFEVSVERRRVARMKGEE